LVPTTGVGGGIVLRLPHGRSNPVFTASTEMLADERVFV
jgi:hypothetical protein